MKQTMLRLITGAILSIVLVSKVASSPIATTEHTTVTLLTERSTVASGSSMWLGLQFKLAEGWHTYWKNPGDSGLPARVHWSAPPYVKLGEIQWPVPERQPYAGFMNFGYHDETTLLIELSVGENTSRDSFPLKVTVEWLICALVCIPEEATLEVEVNITKDNIKVIDNPQSTYLQQLANELPKKIDIPIGVMANKDLIKIITTLNTTKSDDIYFFPDQPNIIENAGIQKLVYQGNELAITAKRKATQVSPKTMSGLISYVDGDKLRGRYFTNVEVNYTENPLVNPTILDPAYWYLIITLCTAFLGGVLLNFMPCVLPVLSIKILSIINEGSRKANQRNAISYTLGVIMSFSCLAIALVVLKALGQEIGWGFQLQSPVFVNILLYLMFAVGLSLSGVFSIGGNITGLGDQWTQARGATGAFFTGILATIVATPCTAPFMASAVGYALTQNSLTTILVFGTLGIGFASPFLILTFIPTLEKSIPKPGAWMITFRQVMAFPMYGASAWLLWVMAQQINIINLGFPLLGLILIAFAAWLSGQREIERKPSKAVQIIIIVLVSMAIMLAVLGGSKAERDNPGYLENGVSEKYNPKKLLDAISAETPVFINHTAAWCITCQFNELNVLSNKAVQQILKEKGVLYLKADWTSGDEEVTRSIEGFKRAGIPLYILYDRDGTYKIMPQLLRTKAFINAIKDL